MARKIINLNSFEKFTLPDDKEEPRTVWTLGPIDAQLMGSIDDGMLGYKVEKGEPQQQASEQWISLWMNRRYVEIVRFGLKGWAHFLNDEGEEVPCLTQEYAVDHVGLRTGVQDQLLKVIRLEDIVVLAQRILDLNKLSGESRKN